MPDVNDVEDLRLISENLAAATRELRETASTVADAVRSQSTSTVTIHAGGIAAGVALSGVGACLMVILLLGIWSVWSDANRKAEQNAWVNVWQGKVVAYEAKIAELEAKEKACVR